MSEPRQSIKSRLEEYLRRKDLTVINESEWEAIQAEFGDASPGYLRRLLRDAEVELAPLVEGVRQESMEALERTLLALLEEYDAAREAGDRERQKSCRALVIEAKDHARWAAQRAREAENRASKQEMAEWLLVWLEDPDAFPPWVRLRKKAIGERR